MVTIPLFGVLSMTVVPTATSSLRHSVTELLTTTLWSRSLNTSNSTSFFPIDTSGAFTPNCGEAHFTHGVAYCYFSFGRGVKLLVFHSSCGFTTVTEVMEEMVVMAIIVHTG